MYRNLLTKISFYKINSLIFVLLTLSIFRYQKKVLNFFNFNDSALVGTLGEISFILLILFSLTYVIKINLKYIIYLFIIFSIWVFLSILLNYHLIDFLYIKKSLQIFYCFYIFLVFSNIKDELNFPLIQNLIIILISVFTLFSLIYNATINGLYLKEIYILF